MRSVDKANKEAKPRKSTSDWNKALCFACDALKKFRAAETMRENNLPDEANTTVKEAMDILKSRYDLSRLIHIASTGLLSNLV